LSHKPGKACKKPHAFPASVIWSGECPADVIDDLRLDLKEAKKKFRKSVRKWERQLKWLREKNAAPQYKAWLREKTEQHLKEKPTFSFSWKPHE
jgi:hypothetical protein